MGRRATSCRRSGSASGRCPWASCDRGANYIDAYLRLEHEASSPALYRMLRQALMARRSLLLLDGLDEAGAKRADIELHVVE